MTKQPEELLAELKECLRELQQKKSFVRHLLILAVMHDHIDDLQTDTVKHARRQGVSWEEIGKGLGISRQAAWERFH